MSEVQRTREGGELVRQRIGDATEAEGFRIDVGRLELTEDIIAITHGPAATFLASFDRGHHVWSVIHMWGPARSWIRMIRRFVGELALRGHGNTPIQWPLLTNRPLVLRAVRRVNVRQATLPSGKRVWEITADEVLVLLSGIAP